MRQHVSRPKWQRRLAAAIVGLFTWSALLAVPAQALAHASLHKPLGVRSLTPVEMQHITGSQPTTAVSAAAGGTYPWEANVGGANTGNGTEYVNTSETLFTGTDLRSVAL